MPKQTTWTCDNPKCSKKHVSTYVPEGWRQVLVMRAPDRVNGQSGILCSACVEIVSHMLPPPLDADLPMKGTD